MTIRPKISDNSSGNAFRSFYYLKEELVSYCRQEGLQATGGKVELTDRIAYYLDTGERLSCQRQAKKSANLGVITLDTPIEDNFICSEKHRSFFSDSIGKGFTFNNFGKLIRSGIGLPDMHYSEFTEFKQGVVLTLVLYNQAYLLHRYNHEGNLLPLRSSRVRIIYSPPLPDRSWRFYPALPQRSADRPDKPEFS